VPAPVVAQTSMSSESEDSDQPNATACQKMRLLSTLDHHDHLYQFSSDSDAYGSGPPDAEHDHLETEFVQSMKVLGEFILITEK